MRCRIKILSLIFSAFNILLCRVKTAEYNLDEVNKEVMDILEKVRFLTNKNDRQLSLLDFKTHSTTAMKNINKAGKPS